MSNTTTTAPTRTVDQYLATWNTTDATERAELIEASIGADLFYRDPMLEADGREAYDAMIAAVQAQFPGLVMRRTSEVDAHHGLLRFGWELGEPGAAPVFAGIDVAVLDGEGRLHRIVGFTGELTALDVA